MKQKHIEDNFEEVLDFSPDWLNTYEEINRDVGSDAAQIFLKSKMKQAHLDANQKLLSKSVGSRLKTWFLNNWLSMLGATIMGFCLTVIILGSMSNRGRAKELRYNFISSPADWQIVDGSSKQIKVKDLRFVDGSSKMTIHLSKKTGEPLFMYVSLYDEDLKPISTDVIDMTSWKSGIKVAESRAYAPQAKWVYYYVSKNQTNP